MNCSSPTAVSPVGISIGGLPLVFSCTDQRFPSLVKEYYSEFATCAEDALLSFTVEVLEPKWVTSDDDVRVWKSGERWCASRGDFHADFGDRRGYIQLQLNPYGLNSILRIVHTIYLAKQRGFLLHAASAIRNGRAFIFSGLSGAGKTTISRCAPEDVTLLTDEISYIRRDGDGFRAHGTPFAGELAKLGHNLAAPISRLFFLEKASRNQILELDRADAMRRLLRNVLFFCQDSELVNKVFETACDLLANIPAYRLAFVPDQSVWELVQ